MTRFIKRICPVLGVLTLLGSAGCLGYRSGANIPNNLRSIHVPAFDNQTAYPMVGAVAAQQFLDALIEDGTFRPGSYDQARLRVQAIVESLDSKAVRYDRNHAIVPEEYRLTLTVKLYLFDRVSGETLINGKRFAASDAVLTRGDFQTGTTDAIPRLAHTLAQRLVEAVITAADRASRPTQP